jgi:spore germination protein
LDQSRQITAMQAGAIMGSTVIGVGVLPLPLFAVRAADSAAPLITLIGLLIGSISLSIVIWLGIRFPRKSIIQYSEDLIGRWLAAIGSFAIIGFFAVLTSLAAREFGEVVVTSVLKTTPVEITVIVMLLLAAIATRNAITTFAYMHYFYFPLLLVPGLLIVALSLKNAEPINLQPIWFQRPQGVMRGVLTIAALFQGNFIMTMIIPSMIAPRKAIKSGLWGMSIGGGLYVVIVAAAVGVFGAEEIKNLLWPTLELAKATSLPANVLERLDAAFLAVWVTAVFTTLLTSYFLTIYATRQLFRLADHRMLSFFMLPFVFAMAMMPQNIVQMYNIVELVGQIGLCLTIGYPALLTLISLIRKKRGKPVANQ